MSLLSDGYDMMRLVSGGSIHACVCVSVSVCVCVCVCEWLCARVAGGFHMGTASHERESERERDQRTCVCDVVQNTTPQRSDPQQHDVCIAPPPHVISHQSPAKRR